MPPGIYTPPAHVRQRRIARDRDLRRLGHENYEAYLDSPQWRAIKRRYREERPWLCNLCGSEESLHMHHRTYERVGQESLDDLMPLCDGCHQTVHALERRGDAGLDPAAVIDEARAIVGRQLLAQQREERDAEDAAGRETVREQMEALPMDERLRRARKVAGRRYVDVSREVWAFGGLVQRRRAPKILQRQLDRIERKAYGPEYWGEAA